MAFRRGKIGLGVFALSAGFLAALPAEADFFTYSEWSGMSVPSKAAYIAGSFDMMGGMPDVDGMIAKWQVCITDSKMNNGQLAQNLAAYVLTKPQLQAGSVRSALWDYLNVLCKMK